MSSDPWLVKPGTKVRLADFDPEQTGSFKHHGEAMAEMAADLLRLRDLQEKLYVDGRQAVLLVLQGMDTSGKDGMVAHLSEGLGLAGAELSTFRAPTPEELSHNFLWRVHRRTPPHGRIGIFNRSHYEDVLVVRVHNLVSKDVWKLRYRQITNFERLLAETGTTVIKCFLHISKDEQRTRLLDRLQEREKLWKLDPDDLKERAYWDTYIDAYEAAIERTSTGHAPWHIIPANHKWFRNYTVTRLLVETLQRLDYKLPPPKVDPDNIVIE